MVTICPATVADASAIAHVHINSWRSTYAGIVPAPFPAALSEDDRTSQWNHWLELDIPVFITETDHHLVGFASGGPARETVPSFDAELFAIYLLESAQHQRLGTALLQTLARALAQRGLTSMIAWVLESNASRHFYEPTGAD